MLQLRKLSISFCLTKPKIRVLVFIYSYLGIDTDRLSLLECLTFGSTLSATDPVTILAIFQQYKVDPKLYSIIFGESLLNDAVSIVMYEYVILSLFYLPKDAASNNHTER